MINIAGQDNTNKSTWSW